jgi:hypothetical protein
MVEQNYILYVNEKKQLRQSKITLKKIGENVNFKFTISEKHLICGLILNGKPLKGDLLKEFPFSPIEKYLFEFTNVFFIIPEMEYKNENIFYNFKVDISSLPNFQYNYETLDYSYIGMRIIRAEGSPVLDGIESYVDSSTWFFHPSFDGVNFEKYKFTENLAGETGMLSYAPYQPFIKDMVGENWVGDYYDNIPKYVYFSDGISQKTNVFLLPVVEE